MLEQIGLLDEGLYTYFDDPDICLRAARAGWETWYVPESRVIHLGGASTGVTGNRPPARRPAYWYQARRRFFLKNYGACYTALADAAFILGLRDLATEAAASAQAGHRPAAHADRLDPPQRLLRRDQGPRGREPGDAPGGGAPEPPLDANTRSSSDELNSKNLCSPTNSHTTVSW